MRGSTWSQTSPLVRRLPEFCASESAPLSWIEMIATDSGAAGGQRCKALYSARRIAKIHLPPRHAAL